MYADDTTLFCNFDTTCNLEKINSELEKIYRWLCSNITIGFVNMCGVEGKRRLCDLNVTSSSPALATRHIRSVLLVNSPNKLNLLS